MTELPDGWQTKKVGELADTQLGKMLNKGKQSGKFAKPYLRTDNVHWGSFDLSEIKEMDIFPEEEDKYLARKGDLLMCEGGASGRTAIWTQDYNISFQNHVHRIRPKDDEEITPKYLLYYFEWFIKNGFASDLIKGVTISSLSQSGLRSIDVVYPPLPEQHKIVEILEDHLSRLDAALADVKQAKVKAAQFRRSLLQAAFTGDLGSHETDLMTELPTVWQRSKIGNHCLSVEKVDPVQLGRNTFKYIDIGSLEPNSSSLEKVSEIPTEGAPGRARQLVRTGDSLFATVRPYMKKVALITDSYSEEIASTGFCVLRPNNETLHSKFLFYFLQSDELLDQVLPLQRGVSYPAIRDNDLRNAMVPLPPLSEQQKIVEILEDHLSRLDASVALADAMENQSSGLRRSLLQAAFTGQLTKEVASV